MDNIISFPGFSGLGDTTTAVTATATAAAQGGANLISDAAAVLAIASVLGTSPGKQTYDNVYKPNAQKVVNAFGTQFVTGCESLGWNTGAVAQALSEFLAMNNINLTPAQLITDGSPSLASPSSNPLSSVTSALSSAVSNLNSSGMMPFVLAGGAGLVLLLMLRK
jgi:hypothetical protein